MWKPRLLGVVIYSTHKIIIPQNVVNRQRYFYNLQSKYFETMIFESPEKAKEKIIRLIKK